MNHMKNAWLLSLIALISMSSCRTAFPEAQTPDDVYYSPEGMRYEEERTQTDEDRYLRMKVRNRRDWSDLNEWYTYERWSYGLNYAYGTPYHPYFYWNVSHNPYWQITTVPRTENRPRISNLNSYQPSGTVSNPRTNPVNPKLTGYGTNPPRNNTYNPKEQTVGSGLRDLFGNGTRNTGTSNPAPTSNNQSATPSQSAPVRKF